MTIIDELGLQTAESPEAEANRADQHEYFKIAIALDIEAGRINEVTLTYIMKRAREEADLAANELFKTPAYDYKRIGELQTVVNRHRDLKRWLIQAIGAGQEAHRVLEARAAED